MKGVKPWLAACAHVSSRTGGESRFLYFDPSGAGLSGNMVLGALLDAMDPKERDVAIAALKRAFHRPGFRVAAEVVSRGSFRGFHIDTAGPEVPAQKLAAEVARAGKALGLGAGAAAFARGVVGELIRAESHVHGRPASRVHLHELAGLDTAFDAVAVAYALERWGHFRAPAAAVYSRPVEVGSGTVTFSHGTTPVPPPVSARLLHEHRIPFTQEAEGEVATPTGIAVLALLAPRFHPPPPSVVVAHGVGAGTRELADRPNLFTFQVRAPVGPRARPVHDPVAQIEVSLDDAPGEAVAHALSRALDEGALDAHIVQTVTKKGRPGQLLLVLAREADADRLADVVAHETGSWGVRIAHRVARFKAVPREERVRVVLGGKRHEVRVKVLVEGGHVRRVKAEHDDAARAAEASGAPLSEVMRAAEEAAARKARRRTGGRAR